MTGSVILVPWHDPASHLGALPDGWEYATFAVDDTGLPDGLDPAAVTFYVPPYTFDPRVYEVIRDLPSVATVQLLTAGYEHALPYLRDDVALANARGVHDASTAELAVALILASQRELDRDARAMTSGTWLTGPTRALADSTVLIVGAGSIGESLARRLTGFECEIVKVASRARDGVHGIDELPALLPTADIVVLLVPLTPQTTGLLGADQLARCRPGALIVNVARGKVVDTPALVAACRSGQVRAAVDVTDPEPLPPDHPLWTTPGVLISPHRGGASAAFLPRARRLVAEQVTRLVAGAPLENLIAR
jgi:phosphoglycerate dehydrogenase-like enzyme